MAAGPSGPAVFCSGVHTAIWSTIRLVSDAVTCDARRLGLAAVASYIQIERLTGVIVYEATQSATAALMQLCERLVSNSQKSAIRGLPSFAPALILFGQKVYNQEGGPLSQTTECDVLEAGPRAVPDRIRLDLSGTFELSGRVAPADSV